MIIEEGIDYTGIEESTDHALASQVQNFKNMLSSPFAKKQLSELGIHVDVQTIPTRLIINVLAFMGVIWLSGKIKSKWVVYAGVAYVGFALLNKSEMVDRKLFEKVGLATKNAVEQYGEFSAISAKVVEEFETTLPTQQMMNS